MMLLIMHDLTPRQIEILKLIIKEYIDTAEAVGSETLEKKYDIGVSPATIRNEMAEMVKLGYLNNPHTSSGRIPSSKALKFYVNELMKEKEMSVAEEVEAKEKVWDSRSTEDRFLREITRSLAEKTGTLAVTTTDDGSIYYAGYSRILEMPEFYDIDITKNFLNILDNFAYLDSVNRGIEDGVGIFMGEDLEEAVLKPYSFVFSRFHTKGNINGSIGVMGPCRLRYDSIVPAVRYFGDLVEEVAEW